MTTTYLVCASNVHFEDQIPILIFHILETDIPQYTSIIDQDMHASKGLDSSLDNSITIFNAVVVGDGLASGFLDLFYDFVCCF
jgi:hypothetical protein